MRRDLNVVGCSPPTRPWSWSRVLVCHLVMPRDRPVRPSSTVVMSEIPPTADPRCRCSVMKFVYRSRSVSCRGIDNPSHVLRGKIQLKFGLSEVVCVVQLNLCDIYLLGLCGLSTVSVHHPQAQAPMHIILPGGAAQPHALTMM